MKDRTTAGVLALVFGWLGLHRFYLGQPGLGILYLIFLPLGFISFFLGFIDGIILLTQDDDLFDAKYNNKPFRPGYSRSERNRSSYQNARDRDRERQQRYQRQEQRQRQRQQPKERRNTNRAPKTNPFKESAIRKYKNYDFEGAIIDFQKSLKVQPTDPVTHFNVACAYSLTEQVEKGYFHLEKAVEQGYNQYDKIKTDGDLAFLRIQDNWEEFVKNGYQSEVKAPVSKQIEAPEAKPIDEVIMKIEKLGELKEKGYLSEEEFQAQKSKLLNGLD